LGRAIDLADTALARQAEAPDAVYWHGVGFFTMQRGLTWHAMPDRRYAAQAAGELTSGLDLLPDGERDSEWAAFFTVAAAESYAAAGGPERAPARRAAPRAYAGQPVPPGSRPRCARSTPNYGSAGRRCRPDASWGTKCAPWSVPGSRNA
jgi:hypothetical protein